MRELGEEFGSYQNCMNLKAAMTKFKNQKTGSSSAEWVAAASAADGSAVIPALVDADEMEKRMKMNNTHIAEIEEQISTRVLKKWGCYLFRTGDACGRLEQFGRQ